MSIAVLAIVLGLGFMAAGFAAWAGRWRQWTGNAYPGRLVFLFPGYGLGTAALGMFIWMSDIHVAAGVTNALLWFGMAVLALSLVGQTWLPWWATPLWYREWRRTVQPSWPRRRPSHD